jgi:hypothetical protein
MCRIVEQSEMVANTKKQEEEEGKRLINDDDYHQVLQF